MRPNNLALVPTPPRVWKRQNALVLSHIYLVNEVALDFEGDVIRKDRPELISIGNLALVQAARSHEADKDGPFVDYAKNKIEEAILAAFDAKQIARYIPDRQRLHQRLQAANAYL